MPANTHTHIAKTENARDVRGNFHLIRPFARVKAVDDIEITIHGYKYSWCAGDAVANAARCTFELLLVSCDIFAASSDAALSRRERNVCIGSEAKKGISKRERYRVALIRF